MTQKLKNSQNKVIIVRGFFPGVGKDFPLDEGDIILKVNNKNVGPSLLLLDKALHESTVEPERAQVTVLCRHKTPEKKDKKE